MCMTYRGIRIENISDILIEAFNVVVIVLFVRLAFILLLRQ